MNEQQEVKNTFKVDIGLAVAYGTMYLFTCVMWIMTCRLAGQCARRK